MPAGSFLRSSVTADLCGWFICTHDDDTIAVLLIPDIFLIATLFIYKDRVCVLKLHCICSVMAVIFYCFRKESALK